MNYRDVELVNNSMQRLGESLLRERMEKQRRQEREENRADANALRQQQITLEERRTKAAEDSARGQADFRQQMLKRDEAKQSIAELQKAYQQLAKDYESGIIDKPEANRRAKAIVDRVRMGPDVILRESPFAVMLETDGELFSDKPVKPETAPADVETDRAAAALEAEAEKQKDPVLKDVLLSRAKKLRSGIGREDPTAFIEESEVVERDEEGRASRTRRRRIPAADLQREKSLIDEANAAIQKGADPAKVKARLKQEYGIDLK